MQIFPQFCSGRASEKVMGHFNSLFGTLWTDKIINEVQNLKIKPVDVYLLDILSFTVLIL